MKIYTGVGDQGRTSLFSGERVLKSDARIEAYGDVDELNSYLGALVASLEPSWTDLAEELRRIQSDLFNVGAWLSTTADSPALKSLTQVSSEDIAHLEKSIDRMQSELPALMGFILPGGHPSAAWAHIARTICRRAERRVVGIYVPDNPAEPEEAQSSDLNSILEPGPLANILVYLNRLSDYLFVMSRYCNHEAAVDDQPWER